MRVPTFLKNASIKRKLTLIVMFTSGFALLVACAAFMAYDSYTARQRMATDLSLVAEGLAINVGPALDFQDARGAEDLLRSLRARANVMAAAVLDAEGQSFASYLRGDMPRSFVAPPAPGAGRLLRGERPARVPRRIRQGRQAAGHGVPAVGHGGAAAAPVALRGHPGGGARGVAPGRLPARGRPAAADLRPRPPPCGGPGAGLAGEGLLAAGGEGVERRAGPSHRRLQRDARADQEPRRRARRSPRRPPSRPTGPRARSWPT